MAFIFTLCFTLYFLARKIDSLPPAPCLAPFRWQDCGKPPVPVMYYWKPGSRCEVGLWKGCLPNMNMFRDEYECVSTCIFASRAMPEDYHNFNEIDFTEDNGDLDMDAMDLDINETNETSEIFNETTMADTTTAAINDTTSDAIDTMDTTLVTGSANATTATALVTITTITSTTTTTDVANVVQ